MLRPLKVLCLLVLPLVLSPGCSRVAGGVLKKAVSGSGSNRTAVQGAKSILPIVDDGCVRIPTPRTASPDPTGSENSMRWLAEEIGMNAAQYALSPPPLPDFSSLQAPPQVPIQQDWRWNIQATRPRVQPSPRPQTYPIHRR